MKLVRTPIGRRRNDTDDCRRYLPVAVRFDTRNNYLDLEVRDDWDPAIREQHLANQAAVRMGLLQELGTSDGERKIDNYRTMGASPFTILTEFDTLLKQIGAAHAHGDFFPALIGACALGERIFNLLILELRKDFIEHPATTKTVRNKQSFTDWTGSIRVLRAWGALSKQSANQLGTLGALRHSSVHFNTSTDVDRRDTSLTALSMVQSVLSDTFGTHGVHYIDGTAGHSYIRLDAETRPLVQRFILPRCALVSPAHRLYPDPAGSTDPLVFDDVEYDPAMLTDGRFAAALVAGEDATHPERHGGLPPDLFELAPLTSSSP